MKAGGNTAGPVHLAGFNAENFYLLIDPRLDRVQLEKLDSESYLAMNRSIFNPNKERSKIAEIGRIILEQDFDLVGLCEVGGMETLATFNRLYLHDRYHCFLHEENSRRGIFVGALLKKGRFPGARARSAGSNFSRNLLRLELGPAAAGLTVFVVHLKSQLGSDHGIGQRVREVQRLAAMVPHRKCVILGDFNGILIPGQHQFEFQPLLDLPFRDVLEEMGIPHDSRRTHYHFGKEPHFTQLDYILCSNDLEIMDAAVLEGEIPLNRAQRDMLPSDHLFIRARVQPLLRQPGKGYTEKAAGPEAKPAGRLSLWKRIIQQLGKAMRRRTP